MVVVDPRAGSGSGVGDLEPYLRRLKITVDKAPLTYGDVAFEGNGPSGKMSIGIERKTLSDMISCIQDARYSANQKIGMRERYQVSILIVEGVWRPDNQTGYLMQLLSSLNWRPYKRGGGLLTKYGMLMRYLLSVQLSGVVVLTTRDIEHTAFEISECYHYFQRKWDSHDSLMAVQKLPIPELNGKPTLVREWASRLPGVGSKLSLEADKVFSSGGEMANASEEDWLRIPGITVSVARNLVREVWGNNNGNH